MSKEYTSIRVTKEAKAEADKSRRDGESWNDYLQRCTENPPQPIEVVDIDDLNVQGGASYDDVREACRAAIREELPDKMGGR